MECKHLELPCMVRRGRECKFSKCMLDSGQQKIKVIRKCPLTQKECVRHCEWFDTDTNRCVVWKLVGSNEK